MSGLRPAPRVGFVDAYAPPRGEPVAPSVAPLRLNANEGRRPDAELLEMLATIDAETVRRYPNAAALETALAARFGVDRPCVIVTAGADDAIDRLCRATLDRGRTAVVTAPTFEMIPRYARLAGADVVSVPWLDRPFPEDELTGALNTDVGAVFVATPNNPTGSVAETDALLRLADAAPSSVLVADLAYVEFADVDPTLSLLARPNIVVTRTFSKAWGLAGLRVGYALGPPEVIDWLRRVGHPYPTSAVSLALAGRALDGDPSTTAAYVERVRRERGRLITYLGERGAEAATTQANFVLARFPDAWCVADALARDGIIVRRFERGSPLDDRLRITCPGDDRDFERLLAAFERAIPSLGVSP